MKNKNVFRKENNMHNTLLPSKRFKNLMKSVYFGSFDHFSLWDSIDLLGLNDGIYFYFGTKKNEESFFFSQLQRSLHFKRRMINQENYLPVLLFSLKNTGNDGNAYIYFFTIFILFFVSF